MIIAVNIFQLMPLDKKPEKKNGIVEVMSLNPVEALIFFRLLFSSCLSWKFTVMIIL